MNGLYLSSWKGSGSYWLSTDDLELSGTWKEEWEHFINELQHLGICLMDGEDFLVYSFNKSIR